MTTLVHSEPAAHAGGHERAADDERALIARAARDPEAFGALYRAHYRPVAGYLYRRVGDAHEAEDLAGEVFIAAWRSIGRYRLRGVPFRAWLLRIATNAANRHVRRTRRREQVHRAGAREGSPMPAGAVEEVEEAQAALLALSPAHQSVLVLFHVEGLSVEQTAQVLGCREGTVKSRLARAREALREELERREDRR